MERHLNTANNRVRNITATGIFPCGVEACLFILLLPNLIKKIKYKEIHRNKKYQIQDSYLWEGQGREFN